MVTDGAPELLVSWPSIMQRSSDLLSTPDVDGGNGKEVGLHLCSRTLVDATIF